MFEKIEGDVGSKQWQKLNHSIVDSKSFKRISNIFDRNKQIMTIVNYSTMLRQLTLLKDENKNKIDYSQFYSKF